MLADQPPIPWLRRRWLSFLVTLDAESIRNFQAMYYVFIMVGGLYLLCFAQLPPQPIEDTLGRPIYVGWLLLNIICPIMMFIGRRLTARASVAEPGAGNPGVGGAWLQLAGDGGIWGAICIYIMCVFSASWWGQGLYAVFFVGMGVPGGAMFTYRSYRRLRQIGRRAR